MILYMVLEQNKDGSTGYRVGGGSSTPKSPKVYESIGRARAYCRTQWNKYYVVEIDTDKLEIVHVGEGR